MSECKLLKRLVPGVGVEPSAVLYSLQVTDSSRTLNASSVSRCSSVVRQLYTEYALGMLSAAVLAPPAKSFLEGPDASQRKTASSCSVTSAETQRPRKPRTA